MATSNEAQDVVWCKYCLQYAAEYYCGDCRDKMCQTCKNSHKGHPHFLNHVIVTYHEREAAVKRCRDHPSQFYTLGCEKCGIPICPECKIKSHLNHEDTDITTFCENAKNKIQNVLTDMQSKERDAGNYMTNGEGFRRSDDFKQVKKYLQDRATEMKTCIDIFLSNSIKEIDKHENNYQKSVENFMRKLSKNLRERRKTCESNLKRLDPIDLTFYLNENPDWNYLSQPHNIQGLTCKIVHFEQKVFDKSLIENLFGTFSFEETNLGKIFEITQTRRPKTAVPRLRALERPFRTDSLTNHQEVSKTEREIPNSTSLDIIKNPIRRAMGIREIPLLLEDLKSSDNFLFHIAYDEQCLFISGYNSKIYTYQNVLKVRKKEPKCEILNVENEPQGLAIGFKNKLVYSYGKNRVIEIGRNVIYQNRKEMTVDIGRNARVLFDKEGYNFRGIHFTSSENYLICAIPDEHLQKNASVMKISNNGNFEHEFTYFRGKPIFSRPYFVCENKTTKDICVSDMDEKVVGLTHFGDVCFKYEGNPSAVCRSPFSPRGIACDGHGNILVADVENDEVHLLNRKGEFVTHVLTCFNHISQPYGICVDSENRVWVVERNKNVGEVQTFAKIKLFQIYKKDNTNNPV